MQTTGQCDAATVHDRRPTAVQEAVCDAAAIVAASPPALWLDRIDRMTQAWRLPPGTVHSAVLDAKSLNESGMRTDGPVPRRQTRPLAPTPPPVGTPLERLTFALPPTAGVRAEAEQPGP